MGSQAWQAAPGAAQASREGATQLVPEQHPPGQLVASQPEHTPPSHVSPGRHALHARPPLPQAAVSVPVRQLAPSQHPVGHDVPSHAQAPATQCWPAAQAGPLPHPNTQTERPEPGVHVQPGSTVHAALHPSPSATF